MKKKSLMVIPSVAATLAAVALVIHARTPQQSPDAELNAALGGAAAIEVGPPPAVSSYDLSSHQTLSRVILLIRENYVEPERIRPYDMFIAALDYIQKTVPEVMVDESQAPERIRVSVGTSEQTFELGGVDQLWEVTMSLRDIFRFLQTELTDPKQRRDIEYAAINGMLSTLDPHSVLLKPESFDEVKTSTKGEFGGVGIVISIREGALTVISPIEGTPASRAGLRPKDRITKIGEESTVNMNLEEAVQRLRGKPGSRVSIWVMRKGWQEPRRYPLTRANIKIESVSSELLAGGIGYLRIKSFQNNTYDDLHDHLERLRKKNRGELKGLVLDLRNNPGGLLDQAILVSDRFIDKGPIVITVSEGNRKREEKNAHFSGTERDYPMAVLVNGGSASASEIVSGALKNHDRAIVIGQQSFGKGSVQVLYDFKDRSALKLTIAQYLTPGDESIQSVGIVPDVEIVPATVSKEAMHLVVDDESPRERDLEKHLERHGSTVLTSTEPTTPEATAKIVHLAPELPATALDDEAVAAEAFEYDFETRLAHDVLAQAGSTQRTAMLAAARSLFEARAAEEERRIEERMKALGVDWSKGAAMAGGQVGAEVRLALSSTSHAGIRAGDTVTVTASVRNTGTETLHRVYGVSASDSPLLKGLEFVFGKIPSGATRSWSVDIKMPDDMMARADSMTVSLADEAGSLKATEATALLAVEEQPRPRFSYVLQLDDRQHGNGDGVLQAGEKADLQVRVTNVGAGEAKEAIVSLKNLAGEPVFLDRGREKLGLLKPGASKTAELKFAVRDDAQIDSVEFRLSMWDNALGGSVVDAFTVPVLPARRADADVRALKIVAREEAPVFSGAAPSASIVGWARPGSLVRSDARIDGEWRRIDLPGLFGFVRESDVKVARQALRATPKHSVRLLTAQAAPIIDLTLPNLATSSDVLQLRGTASDTSRLKDLFVFVNDKKVHYQPLGQVRENPEGILAAPFDAMLPLKKGSNTVMVVVREDEDLVARRVFGVYRGEAAFVADFMKPQPSLEAPH